MNVFILLEMKHFGGSVSGSGTDKYWLISFSLEGRSVLGIGWKTDHRCCLNNSALSLSFMTQRPTCFS